MRHKPAATSSFSSSVSRVLAPAPNSATRSRRAALNPKDLPLSLNLTQLIQLPLAAPGTNFAGFLPSRLGLQIRIPEWPSAALPRSSRIDLALARLVIKENAITVGEFTQALPNPDLAHVILFERLNVLANRLRQLLDLLGVHPNVPGSTRAAIAALRALKTKSILVPGLSSTHSILSKVGNVGARGDETKTKSLLIPRTGPR
jgi:hypothetical protein